MLRFFIAASTASSCFIGILSHIPQTKKRNVFRHSFGKQAIDFYIHFCHFLPRAIVGLIHAATFGFGLDKRAIAASGTLVDLLP